MEIFTKWRSEISQVYNLEYTLTFLCSTKVNAPQNKFSCMFPLEQDKWEVRLTLPESGRKIISDVYAYWLEQV